MSEQQTHAAGAAAVGAPVEQPVRPRAYLHTVRVCNGEPGELDEALSFAADSFPLGDAGLFESISVLPLYEKPTCVAAWLFICKRPGKTMTFASTHDTGSESWPWNEWTTVERFPLALAGPGVAMWPNAKVTGLSPKE